jgi:hypothetical protein
MSPILVRIPVPVLVRIPAIQYAPTPEDGW